MMYDSLKKGDQAKFYKLPQIAEIMKSDQAAQFTKDVYLRELTEQIKKGQSPNRLMLKEPFILRPALQPLSLRPMTTCTQDLSSTCLG